MARLTIAPLAAILMIPSKEFPMTPPTLFRSPLSLCVALTLLAGVGCESGFRIGDWQVIDPDEPLSITRVDLTRTQTAGNSQTLVVNQQLTIDLANGRASFTDSD